MLNSWSRLRRDRIHALPTAFIRIPHVYTTMKPACSMFAQLLRVLNLRLLLLQQIALEAFFVSEFVSGVHPRLTKARKLAAEYFYSCGGVPPCIICCLFCHSCCSHPCCCCSFVGCLHCHRMICAVLGLPCACPGSPLLPSCPPLLQLCVGGT